MKTGEPRRKEEGLHFRPDNRMMTKAIRTTERDQHWGTLLLQAGLPEQANEIQALPIYCGQRQNLQQSDENRMEINHFPRLNSTILQPVGLAQKEWNKHDDRWQHCNQCLYVLSNSLKQNSWEADSHSAVQYTPRISGNMRFYYITHRSPPLDLILSQINPLHTHTFT